MKHLKIPTKRVIEACFDYHQDGGIKPFFILKKEFDVESHIVTKAMERDADRGYIMYLSDMKEAVPTVEGMEFLETLKEDETIN